MRTKFLNGVYGACPRVLCDRALVLPIGMSEDLSISRVKVLNIYKIKVFCPRCEDVYVPRIKFVDIDGAYFGSSFSHIFMQVNKIILIIRRFPI
jgi:casein kinase II subunit beta